MLKLTNVKKQYGAFHLDCSMEVKRGYVTGLVGKNGAGKSTVFKAILGLIQIDGGSIELRPAKVGPDEVLQKQHIGVSFADSGFSNYFNIRQIAAVMEKMYQNFDKAAFLQRCQEANLSITQKLKEFSTGMKGKLKILLATSYGAEFLILDEPTAGLDVVAREDLIDLMRQYMEPGDRSILISSHIASDLEGLCDDIYMIDDGKMVMHEETNVLLDEYGVLKLTREQFERIDPVAILRVMEDTFGYTCLTDQKMFYMENYPDIVVEKSSLDAVITLMVRGNGEVYRK